MTSTRLTHIQKHDIKFNERLQARTSFKQTVAAKFVTTPQMRMCKNFDERVGIFSRAFTKE